jgi:hypothetical protein
MTDYATLLRNAMTLTCRSRRPAFLQAYVPDPQSARRPQGIGKSWAAKDQALDLSSGPISALCADSEKATRGSTEFWLAAQPPTQE